ncbi:MAG: hypothetical protein LBL66_02165 [Clostridiales bacterium]|nr:hypothetical protein [Clostridiales bacterium]
MSGLFWGCAPKRPTDLNDAVRSLTVLAADFVETSHFKHPNAYMADDYTSLALDKGVNTNYGYLAKTIDYRLAVGTYRLTAAARVSVGNETDPVVQLQAVKGGKAVANLNIMGPESRSAYTDYGIEFETEEAFVGFGLYSNGRNDVRMQSITIEKIDKNPDAALLAGYFAEDEPDRGIALADGRLYYYDIRSALESLADYSYQEQLMTLVSVLQGLANRDKPRLFVRFIDDTDANAFMGAQDDNWLDYLSAEKGFLPSGDDVVRVKSAGTLLRIFSGFYDGLTVWDVFSPATYNVGLTDCGVNNRLLVKYSDEINSVYWYLTEKLGLPVRLDLHDKFPGARGSAIWDTDIPSTGSKKSDPYYYAVEKYIKTQKTSPWHLSSYLDGWVGDDGVTQRVYYDENGQVCAGTGGVPYWKNRYFHTDIMNRDYFISKKAFFFDLSPVEDERPVDDERQTTGRDTQTLEYILKENNKNAGDKIVEVGGFTNWQLKYSDASSDYALNGGALEPAMVRLLTQYNATMQADAHSISAMANASVYTHYPARAQYDQSQTKNKMKAAAQSATLANKNYLLFYMGDYDGAAWTNRTMYSMFNDPRLGDYPLMWPICAVNEGRVKHVYDFIYERATGNDVFVGGNNGYGYNYLDVYLTWPREGLNGGFDSYIDQTAAAYRKYDLDIMGMYFGGWDAQNASSTWRTMYAALSKLSPYGVVTSRGRRADSAEDYYNAETGTVFMCKDYFISGRDTTIQCGNGGVLAEGDAQHQISILSQSIDVTAAGRPNFNVCRPVLATPTQVFEAVEGLNRRHPEYAFEIVDPYTFFKLYKEYLDNCIAGLYN